MKINITHNKITKSLLLASAFTALSFSSAFAGNYIVPENSSQNFSNITDLSGGIISAGNASTLRFTNSTLGTSSSRFTTSVGARPDTHVASQSTLDLVNSTVYADYLHISPEVNVQVQLTNSNLYVGNSIRNYLHTGIVYVYDGSKLIAPEITVDYIVIDGSYGEFKSESVRILLANNSIWRTFGGTYVDELSSYDSAVEFVFNSAADTMTILEFDYDGDFNFNFDFTESFIETIANGTGYFEWTFYDVVNGVGYISEEEVSASASNSMYTWTVTKGLGFGDDSRYFRIDNFVLIPEPSTYALIFGTLALGLAIYRRRK